MAEYADTKWASVACGETKRGPAAVTAAASSTARSQRCRKRRRNGRWTLPVEVEIEPLREVLHAGGLLGEWDFESRELISRALSQAVALWVTADKLRRGDNNL
jgi:hypothetical protein